MNLERLNSWHADWSKTKVLVFGLGVSGFAATDTLVELGAEVLVLADNADAEHLDILNVFGVKYSIGKTIEENLEEFRVFAPELFIVSPGIRPDNPLVRKAVERGIPVWTEVDLAWRLKDKWGNSSKWICITGTNGKTTVTHLVAHLLAAAGLDAPMCGNVGHSAAELALERQNPGQQPPDWLVVELSSYQIEQSPELTPAIAVWTTLTPDHLERHGSLEHYRAIKRRLLENAPVRILNGDDADLRSRAASWQGATWITAGDPDDLPSTIQPSLWIRDGQVMAGSGPLFAADALAMPGAHNRQNMLLATAVALGALAPALCPTPVAAQSRAELDKVLRRKVLANGLDRRTLSNVEDKWIKTRFVIDEWMETGRLKPREDWPRAKQNMIRGNFNLGYKEAGKAEVIEKGVRTGRIA